MQCFLFLLLVIKIVTFLLRVKKAMITVQTRDIIKIDIRLIRITLNDGHKERENNYTTMIRIILSTTDK